MIRFGKLSDMKNGWFIGNFEPTLIKTEKFELALHEHQKGYKGQFHYHKYSNEINLVVSGKIIVDDKELIKGDIFIVEPYDIPYVEFLEDTVLVVARDGSFPGDKVIWELK